MTKEPVAKPLEGSSKNSDFALGLSSRIARTKLLEFGPNELSSSKPRPVVLQLLAYFTQPLMAILLIAAVISGISGDWLNASIIVLIVVGSIALDFVQTRRSQVAAEGLRVQVSPTAMVKRDGAWLEVARGNLVPGDLIRLAAGALVPADARLISASDLHVQQSALTGESMPVEKNVGAPGQAVTNLENPADASDLVFVGSSVISGRAEALVLATGSRTLSVALSPAWRDAHRKRSSSAARNRSVCSSCKSCFFWCCSSSWSAPSTNAIRSSRCCSRWRWRSG